MKNMKIKEIINENFKLNENNNENDVNENFKWNEDKNDKDNAEDEENEIIFNEIYILLCIKLSRLKLLFIS